MLIIPVKDGESIDKALKKYKRKYDKTGVVKELRKRQQFIKPSVTKRQQVIRAAYKQRLQSQEEA
ncbi:MULTISPECIES: 30S ribosomal protein S21 [Apibacter]|jgi:small subunit ribosomal protein S21|uniref:Small ribosomal subunit protein bS21 n=1 Tax=Apibacter mensalis TaxID=1586267 RepID=A0A0X3ALM8_9FLAO|nr:MULTISPECIES: 30S ribosomal protein S21 [Apibacter]MCO6565346.1 30S ribosomal protein S21 [Apibacter sp.]MCT6869007.1 30S ribosomal protein S21 [Apibacter sp.]MCX8677059.1 30S ribosomal protein S21 [Apibacter sp. B3919]MXO24560.1 30S ribosomal protein S21 [Apibacter sp. B3924]MXO25804.1 30S ribosomal protein S21 [Apibacter sp. B3813]